MKRKKKWRERCMWSCRRVYAPFTRGEILASAVPTNMTTCEHHSHKSSCVCGHGWYARAVRKTHLVEGDVRRGQPSSSGHSQVRRSREDEKSGGHNTDHNNELTDLRLTFETDDTEKLPPFSSVFAFLAILPFSPSAFTHPAPIYQPTSSRQHGTLRKLQPSAR
jgi:hypothetical protein